jgi:hypothetical protein
MKGLVLYALGFVLVDFIEPMPYSVVIVAKQPPGELQMKSTNGFCNGLKAIKYSNGSVFVQVGSSWYRAIGQEASFIAR